MFTLAKAKVSLLAISLSAAFTVSASQVLPLNDERLLQAPNEAANWLSHGRTYDESRFSPLQQINRDNVKGLNLAWSFEFPDNRGLEATPLVVDGVMYSTGAWSRVFAHDAKTGALLWSYDPQVPKDYLVRACCGPVNRGVAVWQDKVFVGALHGDLIAINRSTGEEVWRTATTDPDKDYTITGAPRVVKGRVIIGNGGAEYGVRGYVSAYDANTGEQDWRFYTVPGNPAEGFENDAMAMAAKTWTGQWWKMGGGGTVWDSMAYDPALNLVYIGVGNGSPWNHKIRSPDGGDNLFLSSIVALNADSGEYVWHYQTTPGETWDFTATQQMILATIEWQGQPRDVIMQAPKNGFFFVLDRKTGQFLSAEAFSKVLWAEGYDANGRPIENPETRYGKDPVVMMPGAIGGHNWHSMSYSADTGLVYIPVLKSIMQYKDPEVFDPKPRHQNFGADLPNDVIISQEFMQVLKLKATRGELVAWDPVKQQAVWTYKHARGWNGGTLATAGGLVFQGTADKKFMAFDAANGDIQWTYDTHLAIVAAPISYEVDGEQYVAVLAKWGGGYPLGVGLEPLPGLDKGRLLVFKLDGKASLPEPELHAREMDPPKPARDLSAAEGKEGKRLYSLYCSGCHGIDVISGGGVPDLRYRVGQYEFDTFKLFVLDGILKDKGMVGFTDVLDETSSELVYQYILQEAHTGYQDQNQPALWQSIKLSFYGLLADLIVWGSDQQTP